VELRAINAALENTSQPDASTGLLEEPDIDLRVAES
jgi:hypothetical protein